MLLSEYREYCLLTIHSEYDTYFKYGPFIYQSKIIINISLQREGMSKYNKIYEFSYQMFGRDCHMVMTSLSGHMMNFDFVGTFRKW